jgi:hydroxyacylglutathione hydrolase
MPSIERIEAFNDNYIWLIEDGSSAVVIDPGDAQPVIQQLNDRSLTLSAVLITHHHFDHVGGVELLRQQYPDIVVYAPRNSPYQDGDITVSDGDSLTLLGIQFDVIAVPGHTLDHIAYFNASWHDHPVLFCGDTLFAGGCGRVFEGTHQQMHHSLQLLAALPNDTAVYCAHEYTLANLLFAQAVEPNNAELKLRVEAVKAARQDNLATVPTSIGLELATNPFLRCDQLAVIGAAARSTNNGQQPANSDQVFAAIRQWKDAF